MADLVSVRGRVIVLARDSRGHPKACGVRTGDGTKYRFSDTPVARFLRDFLDEVVVVFGELDGTEGGEAALQVRAFEPCDMDGWVPAPRSMDFDDWDEDWS